MNNQDKQGDGGWAEELQIGKTRIDKTGPRILYRLQTKDGIQSEIRETDHFSPMIYTLERVASLPAWQSGLEKALDEVTDGRRKYELWASEIVRLVEYREK